MSEWREDTAFLTIDIRLVAGGTWSDGCCSGRGGGGGG